MGINLGAPGDRKDAAGNEWFGFPRPRSRERLEYVFDIKPQIASGGGWYSHNSESIAFDNTDTPWLFASGARGLTKCEVPLLGENDPSATYTVKFYFATIDGKQDESSIDLKLQGKAVTSGFNPAREAGGSRQALIKSFQNIKVERDLLIEIASHTSEGVGQPTIAAIEIIRE